MSVLELINNEKINTSKPCLLPLKVVALNDSQEQALKEVEKNTLTTIIGAAGTGKTSVITAIASHFVLLGRKVLIISKSDHAVDVVCDKLNNLGAGRIALRGGKKDSQFELAHYLLDLLDNKINLSDTKNGNILKYVFKKDTQECVKMLKVNRIKALKTLLSDRENRKNLLVQAKACLAVKKSVKDKIMKEIDFTPVLKAIPIWCVTSVEISNVLPMVKDMYDVCIVDESSEMDIASFMPCAYRSKKAVIVGDNKQLKSLLFMDSKKNTSFFVKNEVLADLQTIWNFRVNSLFDFAQYYTEKCIMLNTQYRMPENVFKFSNDTFYNGMIKSAKKANPDALKKVFVGGETSNNKTCNFKECEEIVKYLKQWLKDNKDNNKTIAVLSMFNAQVDLITKAIKAVIPYDEIEKHKIEVKTSNASQGQEFDICLISHCISDNSKYQSKSFANNNPERLNVMLSRCKEQIINFYSIKNLGNSLLGKYLNSIKEA